MREEHAGLRASCGKVDPVFASAARWVRINDALIQEESIGSDPKSANSLLGPMLEGNAVDWDKIRDKFGAGALQKGIVLRKS